MTLSRSAPQKALMKLIGRGVVILLPVLSGCTGAGNLPPGSNVTGLVTYTGPTSESLRFEAQVPSMYLVGKELALRDTPTFKTPNGWSVMLSCIGKEHRFYEMLRKSLVDAVFESHSSVFSEGQNLYCATKMTLKGGQAMAQARVGCIRFDRKTLLIFVCDINKYQQTSQEETSRTYEQAKAIVKTMSIKQ